MPIQGGLGLELLVTLRALYSDLFDLLRRVLLLDVPHQLVLDGEGLGAGVALPAQVRGQRHLRVAAHKVTLQGALMTEKMTKIDK